MFFLSTPSPSLSSPSSNSVNLLLHSRFSSSKSIGSKIKKRQSNRRIGICRAELSLDAPFVVAIGACVLNSLVFPLSEDPDESVEAGGSPIDSTDARFAVMGVISFIPYFNWLSWIFAWLDTGKQRYLVYTIVYLAPYLRTNLSLSPEESWLPIASIVFCIVHIQLEASIRNGDLKPTDLFGSALNLLPPIIRNKDTHFQGHQGMTKKERSKQKVELPSFKEEIENQIRGWGVPRKQLDNSSNMNERKDTDEKDENVEK